MSFYRMQLCSCCNDVPYGTHERSLKGILRVIFRWTKKEFSSRYFGDKTLSVIDMLSYERVVCNRCKGQSID